MFIEVQFKRGTEFTGRTYDYEIVEGEKVPAKGSIIRMVDTNFNKVCNYTRVKVVDVKTKSGRSQTKIRPIKSSIEEPSIAKK